MPDQFRGKLPIKFEQLVSHDNTLNQWKKTELYTCDLADYITIEVELYNAINVAMTYQFITT